MRVSENSTLLSKNEWKTWMINDYLYCPFTHFRKWLLHWLTAKEWDSVENFERLFIKNGEAFQLLIAHESFDVWSLGCMCFQLLNKDLALLWPCGHDDNLSVDIAKPDSLHALKDFSENFDAMKMELTEDPLAWESCCIDIDQRPESTSFLCSHPRPALLSGNGVKRLMGEEPKFDQSSQW